MSNRRTGVLALGLSFMVLGALMLLMNLEITPLPSFFQLILQRELALSPTSRSFNIWRSNPVPIYLDFYFFNWTNPEEILNNATKPKFVEMGPYRFHENKEVVQIQFHDNGTVSYKQERRWYFDYEYSDGTLEDNVTTLNAVALSAATTVRNWHWIHQTGLSAFLGTSQQKIHEIKTVGEFLFDGYESPLINFAQKMPMIKIPYDKFGWFYTRNGSDVFDGHFNIDTGHNNIDNMGKVYEWQYSNETSYYEGSCNMINGTSGSLFPPVKSKQDRVSMFSPDLCRSISFDYSTEESIEDIKGYRYVGSEYMVDNGTLDPANLCFCNGECVPSGVLNVTSCRFGAPAFVSYPHFFRADPYYASLVEGMLPQRKKHEFYLTLEPTTGIPLDVGARFQINLLLQPIKNVVMYRKVPRVFFPMIWFSNRATMPPHMAQELQLLINLPWISLVFSGAIFLLGVALVAYRILRGAQTDSHQLHAFPETTYGNLSDIIRNPNYKLSNSSPLHHLLAKEAASKSEEHNNYYNTYVASDAQTLATLMCVQVE